MPGDDPKDGCAQIAAAEERPALMKLDEVAELLNVSRRQIARLADGGRMPWGVKLGGARRWRREEITEWLARGCPRVRPAGRPGVRS